MIYSTTITTTIGILHLCCDDQGLSRISLPGSSIKLDNNEACGSKGIPAVLELTARQLHEYFEGKRTVFELPLSLHGTDFQHQVWNIIHRIPYGQTMSYGEIATMLGSPAKARAVGGAAHANPLPLVIPCHRVIGANGSLTGFACGIEMKQQLLNLETNNLLNEKGK